MTQRGRSGGRRSPNRGGRGVRVDDRASPNTNSPTSFVHLTIMESRRPICEGLSLPVVEEEHAEHLIEESIPTRFSVETTLNQPLPIHDSLTPECESGNVIDHRPWLHADKGE